MALLGGSGLPIVAQAAEFTMRVAAVTPPIENNFAWTHLEVLAREIESRSGGRIEVEMYPGAQLGGTTRYPDVVVPSADPSPGSPPPR